MTQIDDSDKETGIQKLSFKETLDNSASYLAALSIIIILIYMVNADLLLEIDLIDLTSDFIVASIFLAIIFYVQQIKANGSFRNWLLIGLSFLYFSFFIDVLDEIYHHSPIIKNIFENVFQVIGLLAALIGVRGWLLYNESVQRQLITNATRDQLTGILNRREFLRLAELEFERSNRYQRSLAAIFIDIDHFKSINDEYGHNIGDEVLKLFANKVESMLRENDIFCRWGGEEFLLLGPEIKIEQSLQMAEKIRKAAETLVIGKRDDEGSLVEISITLSAGCSVIRKEDENVLSVLERADEAMYLAKKDGRNNVCHL